MLWDRMLSISIKSFCDGGDFNPRFASLVACHGYYQYLLNNLETSCVALREVEQVLEERLCTGECSPHCARTLESIYILHTRLIVQSLSSSSH